MSLPALHRHKKRAIVKMACTPELSLRGGRRPTWQSREGTRKFPYAPADRTCPCRGAACRSRRRTCSPYKTPSKWQTLPTCHCEAPPRRGRGALSAQREEVPLGCNLGKAVTFSPGPSCYPTVYCEIATGAKRPRNDKPLAFTVLSTACISRQHCAGRGQPGPYNGRSSAPPFFFYFSTNARRCQPGGHKFSILSHVFRPGGNTIAEKRRCHAKLCLRHAAVLRRGRPRGPRRAARRARAARHGPLFCRKRHGRPLCRGLPRRAGRTILRRRARSPALAGGAGRRPPAGPAAGHRSAAAPPSTAPRASPRSAACPSALWPCRRRPAAAQRSRRSPS